MIFRIIIPGTRGDGGHLGHWQVQASVLKASTYIECYHLTPGINDAVRGCRKGQRHSDSASLYRWRGVERIMVEVMTVSLLWFQWSIKLKGGKKRLKMRFRNRIIDMAIMWNWRHRTLGTIICSETRGHILKEALFILSTDATTH